MVPRAAATAQRSPLLAVDGVVLCRHAAEPGRSHWHVLLIRRGREPYQGMWAFPGGFVELGEDLGAAVHREVAEETGLEGLPFDQFRAFGDPKRDPRSHTVSIVYVAEIAGERPAVCGGSDAAEAAWHALDALPELAFDHREILDDVMLTRHTTL
ncbi:MAG TPA: NUDIX hydrolase [Candidatus Krumholzibacteria bacterium]|nr:NUDIX hydrolase [Candidatus Krumholzibacteria bacterium]